MKPLSLYAFVVIRTKYTFCAENDSIIASYKNDSITLPNATRNGYTFEGWYTSSSGGSLVGKAGATYTPTSSRTLYARWKKTITITYNANGGSNAPSSQTATVYNDTTSYTFVLRTNKPTRTGYVFAGWATSSTSTTVNWQPGDTVEFNSSKTLYAVWAVAQMRLNGVINYYTTIQSAVDAATNNTQMTVTLLINRTESFSVASNKKINLDLNSKTLQSELTNYGTFKISNGTINLPSNMTVTDAAIVNYGIMEIVSGTYRTNKDGWFIVNKESANMTIESGTFVGTFKSDGVVIGNEGNLIINGGTITSTHYGIVTANTKEKIPLSIIKNANITGSPSVQSGNVTGNYEQLYGKTEITSSILNGKVLSSGDSSYIILYYCTVPEETLNAEYGVIARVTKDTEGYDIYIYGVPISNEVRLPTWTTSGGQDDLQWYISTYSNNSWHYRVNISNHKNQTGEYNTDVYKQVNGDSVFILSLLINI